MKVQTEKNEWVLLPTGELVKVAAKKSHSKMSDEDITDDLPSESYVFSNDKDMKLVKKDFSDLVVGTDVPKYKEGETPKAFKEYTFGDTYFSKDKNTPAELISNIRKKHPLILDEEQKYNPYIQLANTLNNEQRMLPVGLVLNVSEQLRKVNEQEENVGQGEIMNEENFQQEEEEEELSKFKLGGYTRRNPKKLQSGGLPSDFWNTQNDSNIGGILGNSISGAGAGAAIGSSFAPGWGTAIGAAVGLGSGVYNTVQSNKEKRNRLGEIKSLYDSRNATSQRMDNVNNLTTLGKLALPSPTYDTIDYTPQTNRIEQTFDNIFRNYDQRKQSALAGNTAQGNTIMRNMNSMGLSPSQASNFAANISGQNIAQGNQVGLQYDNNKDNLTLQRTNMLNPLEIEMENDKVNKQNMQKQEEYNKYLQGINEFGTNQTASLARQDGLNMDAYEMKQGTYNALNREKFDRNAATNNSFNQLQYLTNLPKSGEGSKNDFSTWLNSLSPEQQQMVIATIKTSGFGG